MSSSFNRPFGRAGKFSLAAGAAFTLTVAATPAMAINEARSFLGWGRWNNEGAVGSNVVIAMVEPGHPLPNHITYDGQIDIQLSWPFNQSGNLSGIVIQPETPFGKPVPGRNWNSTHATAVASALVGNGSVRGFAPEARLISGAIATGINPISGVFTGATPTSTSFAMFALTDQEVADSVADALGIPPYTVATVVNSSFSVGGNAARAGENQFDRIANAVAYMTGATLVAPAGNQNEDPFLANLMPPEGSMRSPGAAFNTIAVGRTNQVFTAVVGSSSGGPSPTANWVVAAAPNLIPDDLIMIDPSLPDVESEVFFQDRHGVDIVAPGTLLRLAGSQNNPVNAPSPTAFSDFWFGTSFSSAIVAGAAALVHDVGIRDNLWHNGKPSSLVTKAVLLNSASKISFNNQNMFDDERQAFVTQAALDEREGAGQLDLRRLWNQFARATVKDFVEPDDPRFDGENTLEGFTLDEDGAHSVPTFGTNPEIPFTTFQEIARPPFMDEIQRELFRRSRSGWGRDVEIPFLPGAPWVELGEITGYVAQGGGLVPPPPPDLGDDSFTGPTLPPTSIPSFPRPPLFERPETPEPPTGFPFRSGWDHGRVGFGTIEIPIGVIPSGSALTATLCWHRQERWNLPDFAAPLALIDPELVVPSQFLTADARNARSLPANPDAPERVRNAKPVFEYWDRRITPSHGDCACGFNLESLTTRDGEKVDVEQIERMLDNALDQMHGDELTLANAYNTRGTGLDIQYVISSTVENDPPFVAALEVAAQIWESIIEDPITIQVFVNFDQSGGNFVAAASTLTNGFEYEDVRQALVAKAGMMEQDVIDNLPMDSISFITTGTMPAMDPDDPPVPLVLTSDDFGGISITRPLARTLGFPVDDGIDSVIVFNPNIEFDTNPDSGITPGTIDLVYVMVHELGHMLGFVSNVDRSQSASPNEPPPTMFPPTVLDLFRFGIGGAENNPASPAEFMMLPREFRPGVEAALDTVDLIPGIDETFRFSTGNFNGDGRQSSHWKDDVLLNLFEVIGVMDPTVGPPSSYSEGYPKTSDMLAMGLIGWDIDFFQDPPQPGPGVGTPQAGLVPVIRFRESGSGQGIFPEHVDADELSIEFAHQNLNLSLIRREFDGAGNDLHSISEGLRSDDGGQRWRTVQHIVANNLPFGNYVLRIEWDRVQFDYGGFFLGFQESEPRPGYDRVPEAQLEYGLAWYIDLAQTSGEFLTDNPETIIPGDLNGDGVVDSRDLALLVSHFGSDDRRFDLTGDGRVGSADLSVLLGNFGKTR
ncbi:MAG: hypothetical protein EA376_11080 [Phycisphaeraceae bacterium]|nr:MAG: hypothetical protein EA376_11080 [Phycisphaeraceae bacterium]